jgi:hypothetical protein
LPNLLVRLSMQIIEGISPPNHAETDTIITRLIKTFHASSSISVSQNSIRTEERLV